MQGKEGTLTMKEKEKEHARKLRRVLRKRDRCGVLEVISVQPGIPVAFNATIVRGAATHPQNSRWYEVMIEQQRM